MKISIIGTGYVGLVTGACLSLFSKNFVTCIDRRKDRIEPIKKERKAPFFEKGLDSVIKKGFKNKRFDASLDITKVVYDSDVTFVAVGTPNVGKDIDLNQIKEAAISIGNAIKNKKSFHVVVVKSTVEPGTTEGLVKKTIDSIIVKKENIGYCMNPEFLRQGYAVNDFLNPDRIILGCDSDRTKIIMKKIYSKLNVPFFHTNIINAELAKYASNVFLANTISFSNEISNICEKTKNSDVSIVLDTLSYDRRLSPRRNKTIIRPEILSYLKAGIGFGGSCLPKDILALKNFAKKKRVQTPLIDSIIGINKNRPTNFIKNIEKIVGKLENKKIAIIGLSFKPETDDLRDSPSIQILEYLIKLKAEIFTWDPIVKKSDLPKNIQEKVKHSSKLKVVCKNKDCLLIAHASDYLKNFEWKEIGSTIIFDGRNILKGLKLSDNIIYYPLGKNKD